MREKVYKGTDAEDFLIALFDLHRTPKGYPDLRGEEPHYKPPLYIESKATTTRKSVTMMIPNYQFYYSRRINEDFNNLVNPFGQTELFKSQTPTDKFYYAIVRVNENKKKKINWYVEQKKIWEKLTKREKDPVKRNQKITNELEELGKRIREEKEKQETDEMRLNYDYKKVLILPADLMKKIWLSEKCYGDEKQFPNLKGNRLDSFEHTLETEIERMANKEFTFFYDDETGEPPDFDVVQIKASYVEGLVENKQEAWSRLNKYYPDTKSSDYVFVPGHYIPDLHVSFIDKDDEMINQLIERIFKNVGKILSIRGKRKKLRKELEENLFHTTSTEDYWQLLEWKLPKK